MWYALTDSRALIYAGWPRPRLLALELREIRDITYGLRTDGSGTICFGAVWPEAQSSYRDYALWEGC